MQTPGSSSCHLRFFFVIWWKIIVKICTCHSFASNYSSYFSYNICTWFVVVDILVFCLPYFLTAVQVIVELRSKRPYLPLKCPAIGMALGVGPQSHYNQIQKCYWKYKYRNATTNTNTEMLHTTNTNAQMLLQIQIQKCHKYVPLKRRAIGMAQNILQYVDTNMCRNWLTC